MPYAQSEDSDDDNGVLLTNTYTAHRHLTLGARGRIVSPNNYQLPCPASLFVVFAERTHLVTHTHGRVAVKVKKDSRQMR